MEQNEFRDALCAVLESLGCVKKAIAGASLLNGQPCIAKYRALVNKFNSKFLHYELIVFVYANGWRAVVVEDESITHDGEPFAWRLGTPQPHNERSVHVLLNLVDDWRPVYTPVGSEGAAVHLESLEVEP